MKRRPLKSLPLPYPPCSASTCVVLTCSLQESHTTLVLSSTLKNTIFGCEHHSHSFPKMRCSLQIHSPKLLSSGVQTSNDCSPTLPCKHTFLPTWKIMSAFKDFVPACLFNGKSDLSGFYFPLSLCVPSLQPLICSWVLADSFHSSKNK